MSSLAETMLVRLYPDLARAPDAQVRRDVWRNAAKRCRQSLLLGLVLAVIVGGLVLGAFVGVSRDFVVSPWWPPLLRGLVAAYIVWLVLSLFYPLVARDRMRRLLWEHLAKEGVPICTGCGYDLRGQIGAVCPECGRPLERSGNKRAGELVERC